MPEVQRSEPHAASGTSERDSRVDALLVEGLDHYFAHRYAEAVHVWTRVLFLDRTHGRARAYIERARSAMAERQRRADELVETGHRLVAEGRTADARHLLNEVIAEGGDDDKASSLRARLDRREQLERSRPETRVHDPVQRPAEPAWHWRERSSSRVPAVLLIVFAAVAVGVIGAAVGSNWAGFTGRRDPIATRTPLADWPQVTTSEAALIRARTAFADGRLAEALQALDRVGAGTPFAAEAAALRVRIQQTLLASTPIRSHTEATRR